MYLGIYTIFYTIRYGPGMGLGTYTNTSIGFSIITYFIIYLGTMDLCRSIYAYLSLSNFLNISTSTYNLNFSHCNPFSFLS